MEPHTTATILPALLGVGAACVVWRLADLLYATRRDLRTRARVARLKLLKRGIELTLRRGEQDPLYSFAKSIELRTRIELDELESALEKKV